jgi:hypothetical protein
MGLLDALGLKITNNTKGCIIVKNEKDGTWEVLKPGDTSKDSDGAVLDGEIIKHNSGVDIIITEDENGNITWDYKTDEDRKNDQDINIKKNIYIICVKKKNHKKLSGTYDKDKFQGDHPDWIPPAEIKEECEKCE